MRRGVPDESPQLLQKGVTIANSLLESTKKDTFVIAPNPDLL